jgi:hypothetical protein
MEAFQHLLETNRINIDYLTTHEFSFDDAPKAFDLVVNKSEPYIGIALKYDVSKKHSQEKLVVNKSVAQAKINVSFIGAGSYAQGNLLPNIPVTEKVQRVGVMTNTGTTSKRVAEKFKFQFCASKETDVLDDKTNTLFIATRHDSHAEYVIKGLQNNKHIFVEKPLCLNEEELDIIKDAQSNFVIRINRDQSKILNKSFLSSFISNINYYIIFCDSLNNIITFSHYCVLAYNVINGWCTE